VHSYVKNSPARAWTERRVPINVAPLRVLIVEDNEIGAEALAAYLTIEAMECQIALGGTQAIDKGAAWLPDVIIMDISDAEARWI
jgi:two-component system, OmpR family, response regulator